MREDFPDGPFPGSGPLAQLRGGRALDQAAQFRRRAGLHFQGILPAQLRQHSLDVLLRRFLHDLFLPLASREPSSDLSNARSRLAIPGRMFYSQV